MSSLEFQELSYIFYIGGRINEGELCSKHIHLCHNDPRDNPPASASSVLELQAGTTMSSFPIVILLKQNLQLGLESAFPWGESLSVLGFSSHSSVLPRPPHLAVTEPSGSLSVPPPGKHVQRTIFAGLTVSLYYPHWWGSPSQSLDESLPTP